MKQDSHDDDSDDDEDDVESILLEHTHQVGFLKKKVKAFYKIQSLLKNSKPWGWTSFLTSGGICGHCSDGSSDPIGSRWVSLILISVNLSLFVCLILISFLFSLIFVGYWSASFCLGCLFDIDHNIDHLDINHGHFVFEYY